MTKEHPRNSGQWTEARFQSFIKSALRSASNRWGPKHDVKKEARVERGKYQCAGYQRKPHIVPATIKNGKKRETFIFVDHLFPVIDPATGWVSWDNVIERMFVEKDKLQLLCGDCHTAKTADERELRKNKRNE